MRRPGFEPGGTAVPRAARRFGMCRLYRRSFPAVSQNYGWKRSLSYNLIPVQKPVDAPQVIPNHLAEFCKRNFRLFPERREEIVRASEISHCLILAQPDFLNLLYLACRVCHICSFYLFVFNIVGPISTSAQLYSFNAVCRIKLLNSLDVENLRAARIVCGDTLNRFAKRDVTPLLHKILYL